MISRKVYEKKISELPLGPCCAHCCLDSKSYQYFDIGSFDFRMSSKNVLTSYSINITFAISVDNTTRFVIRNLDQAMVLKCS